MEIFFGLIGIFIGLFVWKVQKEHDIILDFLAYTQSLIEELDLILSPWGFGSELAESRRQSFQKSVFPVIAEWKIRLIKIRFIYYKLSEKHAKNVNKLLNEFREAVNNLVLYDKDNKSPDEVALTNKASNLLYGMDQAYKDNIKVALTQLEEDFKPLIGKPYRAYIKRWISQKI